MVIRKENIIMKKYYILISLFTFLLMGCEEDNLCFDIQSVIQFFVFS